MAIVTPALVSALFTGWKGDFQGALGRAPSQYKDISTTIKSTTKSNTYGWLGQFPGLKEWIGERVINDMKAHGYQIVNKPFESTVGVNVDDIADDEVGIYSPLFASMGEAAGEQPDELCFGALAQGFVNPCYDGQNFFDADHPVYAKEDGTGAVKSVSNIVTQSASYAGDPWFVIDSSRVMKPIIFQERQAPRLIAMDSLTDEQLFMKKLLRFGVDTRCEAGYSFWQLAFGAQAELNGDNLWKAIRGLRGIRADGDRKLGIRPTHLVVPTSMEEEATKILEREMKAENGVAVSNELKGKLKLIVADYL